MVPRGSTCVPAACVWQGAVVASGRGLVHITRDPLAQVQVHTQPSVRAATAPGPGGGLGAPRFRHVPLAEALNSVPALGTSQCLYRQSKSSARLCL